MPFLSIGYLSFIGKRNGSSGASSSKYSQFLIAQLTVMALFIALGTLGVKKFHVDRTVAA